MTQKHSKYIETIIFDLGGVILDIDYNRTIEAFKKLGIPHFDHWYTQSSQTGIFDDFETGKISEQSFVEFLLKEIPDSNCTSEDVINAWNAMLLHWDQRKLDLTQRLRSTYRVCLLSNTNSIHKKAVMTSLREQLGIHSLDKYFDNIYLSHEIGLRKPNPEVFEFVLENEGAKAETTLFLDDSIQHIKGARSVGIQTQLIDREMDVLQFFS